MKTVTFIFFLIFTGVGQLSLAQVEARVHQVFDVGMAERLETSITNPNFEVNIKETYSTVIIVECIISLDLADPQLIEDLIQQGRYKVYVKKENGVITIKANEEQVPVVINGKEAEEYVIYNVAVPEYLEYDY
ncbi:MAG: hypothetical protein MK212_02670 [Saprospiraceae bacterium]|nr:hypothetical protein [Saprospiraceae bacterium]